MASRFGAFTLGFATGALTVIGFQRLREYTESEDYEQLADSVQNHLQELESRITGEDKAKVAKPARVKSGSTAKKTA